MEKYALIILSLIWLVHAFGFLLTWVYWLQVKEYRLDRFKSFFNSKESKEELHTGFVGAKYICLAFSFWISGAFFIYSLIVGIFVVRVVILLAKHKLRRPVFTQRAKRILAVPFIVIAAVYASTYFVDFDNRFVFMLSEFALLLSPFLGVVLTQRSAHKAKIKDIQKARDILEKVKPTVIGVTGSYGKTTTKDFIAEFLSSTYQTKKTLKNFNNEFGVAKSIQSEVKEDTKFFVAEMGAYKKGEIAAITRFVHPSVGIITGIEPQHLDLFGSLENIRSGKFEMIESLPQKGLALFNTTNKECKNLSQKAQKLSTQLRVLNYKRVSAFPKKLDSKTAYIKIEKVDRDSIHFTYKTAKETKKLTTHVTGIHFVENIAAALLVVREYGVSWDAIKKTLKKLKSPEGTMSLRTSQKRNIVILDDSYNSTPSGFGAALEYLSLFEGYSKIVVTKGIIELGQERKTIHKTLSSKIAKIADMLIITGSGNAEELASALDKNKVCMTQDTHKLKKILEKYDQHTVCLIEGKIPQSLSETLNEL